MVDASFDSWLLGKVRANWWISRKFLIFRPLLTAVLRGEPRGTNSAQGQCFFRNPGSIGGKTGPSFLIRHSWLKIPDYSPDAGISWLLRKPGWRRREIQVLFPRLPLRQVRASSDARPRRRHCRWWAARNSRQREDLQVVHPASAGALLDESNGRSTGLAEIVRIEFQNRPIVCAFEPTGGKWLTSRFRSRIRKNSVFRITAEFLRIQLPVNYFWPVA